MPNKGTALALASALLDEACIKRRAHSLQAALLRGRPHPTSFNSGKTGNARRGTRISRNAADRLAGDIAIVASGLRTATLIDQLFLTPADIEALCSFIAEAHPAAAPLLVFLCLTNSDQIFLAHSGLLRDRLNASVHTRIIDAVAGRSHRWLSVPPPLFQALIDALRSHLAVPVVEGQLLPAVIAVDCQTPPAHGSATSLEQSAASGVALAGWLLDYPVAYSLEADLSAAPSSSSVVTRTIDFRTAPSDLLATGQALPSPVENNLSDVQLALLRFQLGERELLAFSLPYCLIDSLPHESSAKLEVDRWDVGVVAADMSQSALVALAESTLRMLSSRRSWAMSDGQGALPASHAPSAQRLSVSIELVELPRVAL